MKIGYKTFEYICDLQRVFAQERTREAERDLLAAQDAAHWPWCMTQEQMNDWNGLCLRLDVMVSRGVLNTPAP